MSDSTAWIMDFDGAVAAVGERELLHLLPQPELLEVPLAPRHCAHVIAWQDTLLPVWDVRAWLVPDSGKTTPSIAAIVGYQARRRQTPNFGTLMLTEPPSRVVISDAQFCELPEDQPGWRSIAISCFDFNGKPVPILDLPSMFSQFRKGSQAV